jgi:hypothetical protein
MSLSLSCPEAVKLVFGQKGIKLVEIPYAPGLPVSPIQKPAFFEKKAFRTREALFRILSDEGLTLVEKLAKMGNTTACSMSFKQRMFLPPESFTRLIIPYIAENPGAFENYLSYLIYQRQFPKGVYNFSKGYRALVRGFFDLLFFAAGLHKDKEKINHGDMADAVYKFHRGPGHASKRTRALGQCGGPEWHDNLSTGEIIGLLIPASLSFGQHIPNIDDNPLQSRSYGKGNPNTGQS